MTDDLSTLVADLGTLTARTARRTRAAVRVTGFEAVGVMQAEEPVDTGAMRSSTRARFAADGMGVDVGPTVNYAGYVAYGTRRQRPNPYDLRTLEIMAPRFEQRCAEAVAEL